MRRNKLKQRIEEGKKALGFNLDFPSPFLVDMLGGTGFDYVLFETEYGGFPFETVANMCRAAEAADLAVMAKLPSNDALTIQRFLDAGVWNIQAPHISTRADAEILANACRFVPAGTRSWTGGRPSLLRRGMTVKEHMQWCDNEVVTVAMLEDKEALGNLDDILDVDGIDFVRYGIGDIALSMGYPGETTHPLVVETLGKITDRIHAAGKKLFYDVSSFVSVSQLVREGSQAFLKKANEGDAPVVPWVRR